MWWLVTGGLHTNYGLITTSSQARVAINPFTLEGVDLPPEDRAMASQSIKTWFVQCGDKFVTNVLPDGYDPENKGNGEDNKIREASRISAWVTYRGGTDLEKLNYGLSKRISIEWVLDGPERMATYKKGTRASNWSIWVETLDVPLRKVVNFDVINGKVVIARSFLRNNNPHPISCAAARVDEP
jgi:hypothetical protein